MCFALWLHTLTSMAYLFLSLQPSVWPSVLGTHSSLARHLTLHNRQSTKHALVSARGICPHPSLHGRYEHSIVMSVAAHIYVTLRVPAPAPNHTRMCMLAYITR